MEYKLGKEVALGTVSKGKIIKIQEGQVKDFVTDVSKWNEPEQNCINLGIGSSDGKTFSRVFTIATDSNGDIMPNSYLGKFIKKYGQPKVDLAVELIANAKGWLEVKL